MSFENFMLLYIGGGSGLVALPKPPVTLEDKAEVTRLLNKAGINTLDLNTVKKNLSLIKAGGLAEMAAPAKVGMALSLKLCSRHV